MVEELSFVRKRTRNRPRSHSQLAAEVADNFLDCGNLERRFAHSLEWNCLSWREMIYFTA